ncbi:MAG: DUF2652 domain-containing protein [Anaerolineales bacterium]
MELKKAALVIADISGYTQFIRVNKGSLLHAEEIISQLLETVTDKAEFPLVLNKFEGDAALMYAETGQAEGAALQDVVRQVQAFFIAFHAKTHTLAGDRSSCPCDACQHILDLQLKAVVHAGMVAFKKIRQFDELAGEDVILAHRLLKNSIPSREYILMTEAVYPLVGDAPGIRAELCEEHYDDLGQVRLKVWYPAIAG